MANLNILLLRYGERRRKNKIEKKQMRSACLRTCLAFEDIAKKNKCDQLGVRAKSRTFSDEKDATVGIRTRVVRFLMQVIQNSEFPLAISNPTDVQFSEIKKLLDYDRITSFQYVVHLFF